MSTISGLLRRAPAVGRPGEQAAGEDRASGRGPFAWLLQVALEDWVTAVLLTAMLVSVAWSVQLARWGDLPSLIPTVLIAGVAGFWAARSRTSWYAAHLIALATGFAVVMW